MIGDDIPRDVVPQGHERVKRALEAGQRAPLFDDQPQGGGLDRLAEAVQVYRIEGGEGPDPGAAPASAFQQAIADQRLDGRADRRPRGTQLVRQLGITKLLARGVFTGQQPAAQLVRDGVRDGHDLQHSVKLYNRLPV